MVVVKVISAELKQQALYAYRSWIRVMNVECFTSTFHSLTLWHHWSAILGLDPRSEDCHWKFHRPKTGPVGRYADHKASLNLTLSLTLTLGFSAGGTMTFGTVAFNFVIVGITFKMNVFKKYIVEGVNGCGRHN